MRFVFRKLIHCRRHLGWQEKWKEKLWKQGIITLTTINMEVLFLLAFHNLQGLLHNNWKKKEKGICYNCDNKCTKGHKCTEKKLFYIEYEEEEERIKKHQKKRIYARTQPQRNKK